MKKIFKFLLFFAVILGFAILSFFMAEKTDFLGIGSMELSTSFQAVDGHQILSWEPLPYPCCYRVEAFSRTTGLVAEEPEAHSYGSEIVFRSSYEVPPAPIPMFYRVTAYGMFGKLFGPSRPIENPDFKEPPSPVPIYRYTENHPASLMPYLVWHTVPNAVCYEVELLSGPPETEGGIALSKKAHLESTRQVFTNGWQADLRKYKGKAEKIYWRARALGLHYEPIGEFSQAEPIAIDPDLPMPDCPLINNFDRMPHFEQPIYPAYSWIPMHGITDYEVELLIQPPDNPNGTEPDPKRMWHRKAQDSTSCYDEYARPYAGEYYWRVRAIDAKGNTIGRYSDAEEFIVKDYTASRVNAAIFGDSVTHGGGALSYSPASLEYCYATYFDFPALNLGRSGDTVRMSLDRFDTDVLPFRPKNLIIFTGSNSLRDASVTAESMLADFAALRQKCEENDIRPIFLTLMPIHPRNIAYAFHTPTDPRWQRKLARVNAFLREQPYCIDIEPYFYDANHAFMDYGFSIDGLHPDIRGKMLIGEIVNMHKEMLRD